MGGGEGGGKGLSSRPEVRDEVRGEYGFSLLAKVIHSGGFRALHTR